MFDSYSLSFEWHRGYKVSLNQVTKIVFLRGSLGILIGVDIFTEAITSLWLSTLCQEMW